jgi:hypothetical protein
LQLQEGVVLLRGLLNQDEQLALMEGIRVSSINYRPTQARNAKSNFLKVLAFDCKKNYDKVPQAFKDFSLRATQEAHKASSVIPPEYKPDYCTSFKVSLIFSFSFSFFRIFSDFSYFLSNQHHQYPVNDGRLTGHCDKVLGWVVLFSLGNTARFFVKGPQMSARKSKHIHTQKGVTPNCSLHKLIYCLLLLLLLQSLILNQVTFSCSTVERSMTSTTESTRSCPTRALLGCWNRSKTSA